MRKLNVTYRSLQKNGLIPLQYRKVALPYVSHVKNDFKYDVYGHPTPP